MDLRISFNQVTLWMRRAGLVRTLGIILVAAALLSGIATYLVLTGATPFGTDPGLARLLLLTNLVLLLLLTVVVVRRLAWLWAQRRSGAAGSRLHVRIVVLFSTVAVAPAIIIAVFSYLYLTLVLETRFSEPVRMAVQESVAVAEAYIEEHRKTIQADVLAMAADLNRDARQLARSPALLNQVFNTQALVRSLSEAMLFERSGQVLARSGLSLLMEFEKVPQWALDKAADGEVVIVTSNAEDRVRALVRLDNFVGTYLYVGRLIEPKVLDRLERTRQAEEVYRNLESDRAGMEVRFALIFVLVTLLVVFAAVAFGLAIATGMVKPISGMIRVAGQVSEGDLSARLGQIAGDDEMAMLGRAFNRMTIQLETQRAALIEANRKLDERRRFTETVLAGVSAGVIGLDRDGCITLPNPSAVALLETSASALVGSSFDTAVPEMAELLHEARMRPDRRVQGQVVVRRGSRPRNLLVGIVTERHDDAIQGYVVTFDDITELVSAQRTAAWADVARRIAHEIKNPLTPIQLSAERLKRKYLKEIASDPEIFTKCTDTIIRQVGDIGRMVDEFSAFARLPAPVFKIENLAELIRQAVFLQHLAHPQIDYRTLLPEGPLPLRCDGRQVAQVLTNLLKNAAEAIEGRAQIEAAPPPGTILVRVAPRPQELVVEVVDNGRGLPVEERNHLTEPYVTTRSKGTGLGLAIVKKIMEEHGGELALHDAPGGGALIRLTFRTGSGMLVAPEPERRAAAATQKVGHGA